MTKRIISLLQELKTLDITENTNIFFNISNPNRLIAVLNKYSNITNFNLVKYNILNSQDLINLITLVKDNFIINLKNSIKSIKSKNNVFMLFLDDTKINILISVFDDILICLNDNNNFSNLQNYIEIVKYINSYLVFYNKYNLILTNLELYKLLLYINNYLKTESQTINIYTISTNPNLQSIILDNNNVLFEEYLAKSTDSNIVNIPDNDIAKVSINSLAKITSISKTNKVFTTDVVSYNDNIYDENTLLLEYKTNKTFKDFNTLFNYTIQRFYSFIIIITNNNERVKSIKHNLIILSKNMKTLYNIISENLNIHKSFNSIIGEIILIIRMLNTIIKYNSTNINNLSCFIIKLLRLLLNSYDNEKSLSINYIYNKDNDIYYKINKELMLYFINKTLLLNINEIHLLYNEFDIYNESLLLISFDPSNKIDNMSAYKKYEIIKSNNLQTFIEYIKTFLKKNFIYYLDNKLIINDSKHFLYINLLKLLNNIKYNDELIEINYNKYNEIKYLIIFINYFTFINYFAHTVTYNYLNSAICIEIIRLLKQLVNYLTNNGNGGIYDIAYIKIYSFNLYTLEGTRVINIDKNNNLMNKTDYNNTYKDYNEYLIIDENFYLNMLKYYTSKLNRLYHEELQDTFLKQIGGNNNKYNKIGKKITVIYKKKKYTRVIYTCKSIKYIKINKTYMLLSKLKKV